MPLDLSLFPSRKTAELGCEFELVDVKRQPTGVFIRVKGADSETYRSLVHDIQQRRRTDISRSLRLRPEQVEEDEIEILAGVTMGWRGVEENGAEIPFTMARARQLYYEIPGIREQVDAAIHNRANFFPRTETS